MMSTQLENPPFDESFFQQNLPQYYRFILQNFRRITRSFVLFNTLFAAVFAAEFFFFLFFLPFLSQSTLLAVSLGGLFLTCFSYLVLLFYFQAKKPEQLALLKDQFTASCRQILGAPEGEPQHHLSLAAALAKLASYLEDFEWQFYRIPRLLAPLSRPLATLFAFCHWQDVFRMKQILLNAAIDEHLRQIRLTPTDLEVHASLANTYIALSKLYVEPKRTPAPSAYRKKKEFFEANFRAAAHLAMEEFQILNHYAPNDPWVHEQLAQGYRDLRMPEEEIREVETLLRLRPQDRDLLFRLGSLYFEQGHNANGLRVYEELKKANYKKAEDLIAYYGQSPGAEALIL